MKRFCLLFLACFCLSAGSVVCQINQTLPLNGYINPINTGHPKTNKDSSNIQPLNAEATNYSGISFGILVGINYFHPQLEVRRSSEATGTQAGLTYLYNYSLKNSLVLGFSFEYRFYKEVFIRLQLINSFQKYESSTFDPRQNDPSSLAHVTMNTLVFPNIDFGLNFDIKHLPLSIIWYAGIGLQNNQTQSQELSGTYAVFNTGIGIQYHLLPVLDLELSGTISAMAPSSNGGTYDGYSLSGNGTEFIAGIYVVL